MNMIPHVTYDDIPSYTGISWTCETCCELWAGVLFQSVWSCNWKRRRNSGQWQPACKNGVSFVCPKIFSKTELYEGLFILAFLFLLHLTANLQVDFLANNDENISLFGHNGSKINY